MNKEELIEHHKRTCAVIGISGESAVVCAGGSMVLHGLIEDTNDLDIGVPVEIFNRLALVRGCKAYPLQSNYAGMKELMIVDIKPFADVHPRFPFANTVIIDGVRTYTLEETLKFKKALSRDKDLGDIELIEDYLEGRKDELPSLPKKETVCKPTFGQPPIGDIRVIGKTMDRLRQTGRTSRMAEEISHCLLKQEKVVVHISPGTSVAIQLLIEKAFGPNFVAVQQNLSFSIPTLSEFYILNIDELRSQELPVNRGKCVFIDHALVESAFYRELVHLHRFDRFFSFSKEYKEATGALMGGLRQSHRYSFMISSAIDALATHQEITIVSSGPEVEMTQSIVYDCLVDKHGKDDADVLLARIKVIDCDSRVVLHKYTVKPIATTFISWNIVDKLLASELIALHRYDKYILL